MAVIFHPDLRGKRPLAKYPFLEFIGSDIDILAPPSFLVGRLVKDFDKLPGILYIWHRRGFPAPPCCILCVIVILLPEKLCFPEKTKARKLVRNNMVSGDIIREEGLDIYCQSATSLENPLTLTPHSKELFKIDIPLMRIIMRVLCIGMSEIVRRRSDDQIDTPVRYTGKRLMCIRTYDTVDKR